jgi:hypothetical protein
MALSTADRTVVFAEVNSTTYAHAFSAEEIDHALTSALELFSNCESYVCLGFSNLQLTDGRMQRPTSFAMELIPALLYAHRQFGRRLPLALRQKLTNKTQTHDTLFELLCLGAFQPFHTVHYEPALANGKVSDLMLIFGDELTIYIECKCQSFFGSDHEQLFARVTNRAIQILDIDNCPSIKAAWDNGLRAELHFARTPSDKEMADFEALISNHQRPKSVADIECGGSIQLRFVPRDQPFHRDLPHPAGIMKVETTETRMDHSNVRVAIYPWPGLDVIRRRSQRRLLRSARRKLTAIPPAARGLICIQTFFSAQFAPDIHKLIEQSEYERIPMVWLNPNDAGRLIFRDDAFSLRDRVFGPLIAKHGPKGSTNCTISGC